MDTSIVHKRQLFKYIPTRWMSTIRSWHREDQYCSSAMYCLGWQVLSIPGIVKSIPCFLPLPQELLDVPFFPFQRDGFALWEWRFSVELSAVGLVASFTLQIMSIFSLCWRKAVSFFTKPLGFKTKFKCHSQTFLNFLQVSGFSSPTNIYKYITEVSIFTSYAIRNMDVKSQQRKEEKEVVYWIF